MNEEDKNIIKNIILFLEENEQYGDNWENELKVLNKILTKTKEERNKKQILITFLIVAVLD